MPPKRKGPLQLVHGEVNEINKQVCQRNYYAMHLPVVAKQTGFQIRRVSCLYNMDVFKPKATLSVDGLLNTCAAVFLFIYF